MTQTMERNQINQDPIETEKIYRNCSPSFLIEEIVKREEGMMSDEGAVIVDTLPCTGRSPKDRFIVNYPQIANNPIYWGKINKPISPEHFDGIYRKIQKYLKGKTVFIQDMLAGAHPDYQLPIQIITENAWQSLFAHDLFLRIPSGVSNKPEPQFTLIAVPGFEADPEVDGTNSGVFILIDFECRLVLIGGTRYAGEIKKSIFSVMNYLMPLQGVLSMHCSANIGMSGDVALFFGLSGTGKTTLSSDPERCLIGDDEHGWGDDGIFNFEGGCYAKTINLRQDLEPLIWKATHRYGSVLENVVNDPITRKIDFSDGSLTENTRGAYPIYFIANHVPEGRGDHPKNVFFLTADASGVMPPLARLNTHQAMYYFLSGYTSKLAGTEKGLGADPQATFSTCFGEPFLPLNPNVYARLLGQKIVRHDVRVWLINTGWTGGPYGVGKRISLPHTRAMVKAVLTNQLENTRTRVDPVFGLTIPVECPGVPSNLLNPRTTWTDPSTYDKQAEKIAFQFIENFKQFEQDVDPAVCKAGPLLLSKPV
jgi:phosphoenolpyruvate carboxykinase (ATP)